MESLQGQKGPDEESSNPREVPEPHPTFSTPGPSGSRTPPLPLVNVNALGLEALAHVQGCVGLLASLAPSPALSLPDLLALQRLRERLSLLQGNLLDILRLSSPSSSRGELFSSQWTLGSEATPSTILSQALLTTVGLPQRTPPRGAPAFESGAQLAARRLGDFHPMPLSDAMRDAGYSVRGPVGGPAEDLSILRQLQEETRKVETASTTEPQGEPSLRGFNPDKAVTRGGLGQQHSSGLKGTEEQPSLAARELLWEGAPSLDESDRVLTLTGSAQCSLSTPSGIVVGRTASHEVPMLSTKGSTVPKKASGRNKGETRAGGGLAGVEALMDKTLQGGPAPKMPTPLLSAGLRSVREAVSYDIAVAPSHDGFQWHRYGKKAIKDAAFPRVYYRCAEESCQAKKFMQVLKKEEEPSRGSLSRRTKWVTAVSYENEHNHPPLLPAEIQGTGQKGSPRTPPSVHQHNAEKLHSEESPRTQEGQRGNRALSTGGVDGRRGNSQGEMGDGEDLAAGFRICASKGPWIPFETRHLSRSDLGSSSGSRSAEEQGERPAENCYTEESREPEEGGLPSPKKRRKLSSVPASACAETHVGGRHPVRVLQLENIERRAPEDDTEVSLGDSLQVNIPSERNPHAEKADPMPAGGLKEGQEKAFPTPVALRLFGQTMTHTRDTNSN